MKINVSKQTVFKFSNESEWAHIGVSAGTATDRLSDDIRTWVTVTIHSSFENMAYHWSHTGGDHWADFLHGPDQMDYFMTKLVGSRDDLEEFDINESIRELRETLLLSRREYSITKVEARNMWDDIDELRDCPEHEFYDTIYEIPLFSDDYHEYGHYRIKPWVTAFWEKLWVPWTEEVINNQEFRDAV